MKIILMLSGALTLTGCISTHPHSTWSKSNLTPAQIDCAYETSLAKLNTAEHDAKLDTCLKTHGYNKE